MPHPWKVRLVAMPVAIAAAMIILGSLAGSVTATQNHQACTDCHRRPDAVAVGAPVKIAIDCTDCHLDQRSQTPVSGITHDHRSLACSACHDHHPNQRPFQFRAALVEKGSVRGAFDDETRLCVGCHYQAGQFQGFGGGYVRHPIGIPVPRHDSHVGGPGDATVAAATNGHRPVRLPLVLAADDDGRHVGVIGCATCHSVHHNSNAFLLRWKARQTVEACASCHRQTIGDDVAVGESRTAETLMGASDPDDDE